jgi:hypothetical protein
VVIRQQTIQTDFPRYSPSSVKPVFVRFRMPTTFHIPGSINPSEKTLSWLLMSLGSEPSYMLMYIQPHFWRGTVLIYIEGLCLYALVCGFRFGSSVFLEVEIFKTLTEYSSRGPLGCDAVWCCGRIPTFRSTLLTQSEGSSMDLWNTGFSPYLYTASHQEDHDMNFHRCEKLKSHKIICSSLVGLGNTIF